MAVPLTNPLHLYRALLRECSYLPDSQARVYLRDHVTRSYRNYLPRYHARRKEIPLSRQVALLRRGRKALSILHRANEGYLKPLQNVLLWTYGRKGRRRRELMAKIMQQDIPQDHKAVEALSGIQTYSRKWTPPSMVIALMRSQANEADNLDRAVIGPNSVRPKPDVPAKNTWGRPMPEKRVRNLMQKWYAKQVSRLLPPLPESEFQRLRALSEGKVEALDGPLARRKQAVGLPKDDTLLNERLVLAGPPKSRTFETYALGRPHRLTSRLLQRTWLNIFNHVPHMTWDTTNKKWEVKWNIKCRARPHLKEGSEERLETLFGSLDI